MYHTKNIQAVARTPILINAKEIKQNEKYHFNSPDGVVIVCGLFYNRW